MGILEQVEYSLKLIGSKQSATSRLLISIILFIILYIGIYYIYSFVSSYFPANMKLLSSTWVKLLLATTSALSIATWYLVRPVKLARQKIQRLLYELPDLLDMFSARQNVTITDMVREAADPVQYGIAGRVFELIKRELDKGTSFERAVDKIATKLKIPEFNIIRNILLSIYRDATYDSTIISDTLAFAATMLRTHNIQQELKRATLSSINSMIIIGQGLILPGSSGLAVGLASKMGVSLGTSINIENLISMLFIFILINSIAAASASAIINSKSREEILTNVFLYLPLYIPLNVISFVLGLIISLGTL